MISSPTIRTAALSAVLLAASASAVAGADTDSCVLPSPASVSTYLVTDGDETVNIRAQPTTRADILAVCDNLGEVAILGKNGAWYRVQLALRPYQPQDRRLIDGYVHQSQVSLRHVYIVHSADGTANLRMNANIRAEIQQRIPNGTTLIERPANRRGDWLYVGVQGRGGDTYGYVHKSQIRPKAVR
ncbi:MULTISPECIES: SH3 domain-containing protein [Eikenella]|uniref:SH3b domain-containing protein n=1 Tax=Eikenella longinqua TaxID=1795827 RepID=A0A1A9S1S1_9NEIS|nr:MULTISPECIES: SH3 domain-containing protein [Eikenella]OAM30894.1 hypothetical protein A7P95_02550 [Eikenella longinqua]